MFDEGAEIGNNLRHYSSARFARLNQMMLANGALLGAMQFDTFKPARLWLPLIGIVVTTAFWVMCERTAQYYWAFRGYVEKNGGVSGNAMYASLPKRPRVLNTSIAIRVLFVTLLVLWILLEIRPVG